MLGRISEKQNGFVSILKTHYSTIPLFHHSKLKAYQFPIEVYLSEVNLSLYFSDDNSFRFTHRCACQASQTVLGSDGNCLVRHFKNIYRTHFQTLFTGITFVRVHVNQIDFVISQCLRHNSSLLMSYPLKHFLFGLEILFH